MKMAVNKRRDNENVELDFDSFSDYLLTPVEPHEEIDVEDLEAEFIDMTEPQAEDDLFDDEDATHFEADQNHTASSGSNSGAAKKLLSYGMALFWSIIVDFLFSLINRITPGSYSLPKSHISQCAEIFAEILQEYGIDDTHMSPWLRLLVVTADGSKKGINDTTKTIFMKPKKRSGNGEAKEREKEQDEAA